MPVQEWHIFPSRIAAHELQAYHQNEDNEQLQAQLDTHRWIPVSERLPEDSQKVIVAIMKNDEMDSEEGIDYGFWCDAGWLDCDKWARLELKYISHWKPIILPE